MNKQQEALRLALEALKKCDAALAEELAAWDIDPPLHHVLEASNACGPAITAINDALADHTEQPLEMVAEQPAPPPECQTEAEKTAFAFGWWKALEENRKQPAQQAQHAAIKTLEALGYTYHGAELWKPPLGKPAQQQEPFCYHDGHDIVGKEFADHSDVFPLYTSPPASKPLTDEQIENLWQNTSPYYDHQDFARAIEAAHGITGETK